MTSSLLDTTLDLSVLGGYTSVGYRIRSRSWTPPPRMEGKVVLITGATSGLGLAAADGFARLGAAVWLAVRNRERGEVARARIVEHLRGADVHLGSCDLSRLDSGRFWHDRRRHATHLVPGTRETEEERGRLWSECAALSSTPAN